MWYWEYKVKILDADGEDTLAGIVTGNTLTEAMQQIEDYYGEIIEVQMLKAITDGVFEFRAVMDDDEFDYVISEKLI